MRVKFRAARREDVAAIVALFSDDILGHARENNAELAPYLEAFEAIAQESHNEVIVGEDVQGTIIATYQLTFISGLSLGASRRAQIEGVRVAREMRGEGIGAAMLRDAEDRARAAGCSLVQLTMNSARDEARRFYEREGFVASHVGFKKPLD
ncbi:GNAT family N-acetyltransferase [Roseovarius faecimaris]|uniref:GNAT family N-acetyltransferase n=1 Tax=Roseovarius faecimaris TaxID=2494550 RepID=A0A6I6INQ6_9RHOB|nr:GNAT family N-acetyltransferase [Roseovarius faecimaris]QGX97441.1 GNAT family N-acetyltransferase [Roseovarius faecimaris]